MSKSPRILILGFGSVRNYGGEAIIQGTCKLIKDIWPDAHITIATSDLENTKSVLVDYNDIVFVEDKKRFTFKRLVKGLFRRIGIGKGEPVRYDFSLIDNNDIFLSVGGDIFVEQPEKYISEELKDLVTLGYRTIKQNKIYCLWGASVGPFSNKDDFEYIAKSLQKATLITLREDNAVEYVNSMGCYDNVVKIGDPAFVMEPKECDIKIRDNDDEIIIGLNLSKLAMKFIFGVDYKEEDFIKIVESVDSILEMNKKIKIVFIPHVMSDNSGPQDDFSFLQEIRNKLTNKENTILLPSNLASQKTKFVMKQCDFTIAARMHCFVGSVSVGTPSIMVAYSDKGYGMAKYVYENDNWTIPLEKFNLEIQNKVKDMINEKNELKNYLTERNKYFKEESYKAIYSLKKKWDR